MLQGPYIFLEIGKRFTYFQTSLTYWNATQMLKDFLILGKKTANKKYGKVKTRCINIKELLCNSISTSNIYSLFNVL